MHRKNRKRTHILNINREKKTLKILNDDFNSQKWWQEHEKVLQGTNFNACKWRNKFCLKRWKNFLLWCVDPWNISKSWTVFFDGFQEVVDTNFGNYVLPFKKWKFPVQNSQWMHWCHYSVLNENDPHMFNPN